MSLYCVYLMIEREKDEQPAGTAGHPMMFL